MRRRPWVSAHLFYNDGLDALIYEGIRPVVQELRAREIIDGHFFIRYWQGGPHVRFRILPKRGANEQAIRQIVDERISEFFTLRPSKTSIRREQYEKVASSFSRLEYGHEDTWPIYPNNSIHYLPYKPDYERYGGVESMPAVECHFTDSSEIIFDLVGSGANRNQRTGQALSMMLLAAAQFCENDAERLLRFFQIGDLIWGSKLTIGDRSRYEAQFERQYNNQRPQLHKLVRHLLNFARQETEVHHGSVFSRWSTSVRTLKHRLTRLEQEGSFEPRGLVPSVSPTATAQLGYNALVLYCSHMNNNRLGISLNEEAYLVFLLRKVLAEQVKTGGHSDAL